MKNNVGVEVLVESEQRLHSLFITHNEEIFFACSDGSMMKFKEGHKSHIQLGGELRGVVMDNQGKRCYFTDISNGVIWMKEMEDKSNQVNLVTNEFESVPFLGPHSMALSEDGNNLYFTDSGPWGETSIENPKGSVFVLDIPLGLVRPLALQCLAYPTGLVLSNNDKLLYVCETAKNRVLRFNLSGDRFGMFR